MHKLFFLSAGYTSLALALIGIPLPVLPSTPFALLACFCFAKSSPELRQKLEHSKLFGKAIANWREHRAISIRSKITATTLVFFSVLGISYSALPTPIIVITLIILCAVMTFVWTRQNP